MSTQVMRERQEQERLVAEEMDFERIMGWGLGPMDALDKEQEVCSSHLHPLRNLRSLFILMLRVMATVTRKGADVPEIGRESYYDHNSLQG